MDITLQIENLFRKDRSKLLSFIRERVRSKEDAEDILQDVLTNVLAAKDTNNKIENIGAWVFASVKNKIIDWYRNCLLYTSPSPRDRTRSRMPSSA